MSLKCNVCSSAESWDKCESKETTCQAGFDRCMKIYAKYGDIKVYRKSCSAKVFCDKKKNTICMAADLVKDSECDVNCCGGDLCNAGSAAKISGIVLMACALTLLAYRNE